VVTTGSRSFDRGVHRGKSVASRDARWLVEGGLQHALRLVGRDRADDRGLRVRAEEPGLPVTVRCDDHGCDPLAKS
jgi:hypothetical protein